MRISGNKPIAGVQSGGAKKRSGAAGSSFSPELGTSEDTAKLSETAGGASIQGMDALLALQEVDENSDRRRKAARHGHTLLDGLESVKIDLLAGQVSEERLENLAKTVAGRQSSGDANVDAVLDEIELRVKVELAKLGRFPDE